MLYIKIFLAILAFGILYSCDDDNDAEPDSESNEHKEIGTAQIGDHETTFYQTREPATRPDTLIVEVSSEVEAPMDEVSIFAKHSDKGEVLEAKTIKEDDGEEDATGAFWIPPRSGEWELSASIQDDTTQEALIIDVEKHGKGLTFDDDAGANYHLHWTSPAEPSVGENEVDLGLLRKSGEQWNLEENLDLEIKPWMPSMDHGSEGNEHPERVINGLYQGKVNFNMSGDWDVHVTLLEQDEEISEQTFEWTIDE